MLPLRESGIFCAAKNGIHIDLLEICVICVNRRWVIRDGDSVKIELSSGKARIYRGFLRFV